MKMVKVKIPWVYGIEGVGYKSPRQAVYEGGAYLLPLAILPVLVL